MQKTAVAEIEPWLADLMKIIVQYLQPDDEGRIGTVLQMRQCLKAVQDYNSIQNNILDDKPWQQILHGSIYSLELLDWIETARSNQTFAEWLKDRQSQSVENLQEMQKSPLSMMKSLLLTTLVSRGETIETRS